MRRLRARAPFRDERDWGSEKAQQAHPAQERFGGGRESPRSDGLVKGDWQDELPVPRTDLEPVLRKRVGDLPIGKHAVRFRTHAEPADCTAGVLPMVPLSPMPLAPSGFTGVGVSMWMTSKLGSSAAEIIA